MKIGFNCLPKSCYKSSSPSIMEPWIVVFFYGPNCMVNPIIKSSEMDIYFTTVLNEVKYRSIKTASYFVLFGGTGQIFQAFWKFSSESRVNEISVSISSSKQAWGHGSPSSSGGIWVIFLIVGIIILRQRTLLHLPQRLKYRAKVVVFSRFFNNESSLLKQHSECSNY